MRRSKTRGKHGQRVIQPVNIDQKLRRRSVKVLGEGRSDSSSVATYWLPEIEGRVSESDERKRKMHSEFLRAYEDRQKEIEALNEDQKILRRREGDDKEKRKSTSKDRKVRVLKDKSGKEGLKRRKSGNQKAEKDRGLKKSGKGTSNEKIRKENSKEKIRKEKRSKVEVRKGNEKEKKGKKSKKGKKVKHVSEKISTEGDGVSVATEKITKKKSKKGKPIQKNTSLLDISGTSPKKDIKKKRKTKTSQSQSGKTSGTPIRNKKLRPLSSGSSSSSVPTRRPHVRDIFAFTFDDSSDKNQEVPVEENEIAEISPKDIPDIKSSSSGDSLIYRNKNSDQPDQIESPQELNPSPPTDIPPPPYIQRNPISSSTSDSSEKADTILTRFNVEHVLISNHTSYPVFSKYKDNTSIIPQRTTDTRTAPFMFNIEDARPIRVLVKQRKRKNRSN